MFIYEIKNNINGKIYIGQTIQNPLMRWTQHKYKLNVNKHDNRHLQFAWNKYGSDVFTFNVLDSTNNIEELNSLEDKYIQEYKTTNKKLGYNFRQGGMNGMHSAESKKLISQSLTGKIHSDESKRKKAKSRRKIGYPTVISPKGVQYNIEDMTNFCKDHNLHPTGMFDLVNKKCRQYKGWTLEGTNLNISQFDLIAKMHRPNGYPSLKDPNGNIYKEIVNMSKFCKEHGLSNTNVSSMIAKKAKSHKGWTVVWETGVNS
jgi:group I intron endonuclease